MRSHGATPGKAHYLCNAYVVGARLRRLPVRLREQILGNDAWGPLQGSRGRRVGGWRHQDRRLIVVWRPERARKDARDRRKAVERLLDRLNRSSNPKELLSGQGAGRFIAVTGAARLTVDPEKIAEAGRRDGLAGVITGLRDATVAEARDAIVAEARDAIVARVLSHCNGLRQVEDSFRITGHDLRVRPVRRRTPDRIAIAFMAFACVRRLAWRVAIRKRRMSPEAIRSALVHRQCPILRCRQSGNRHVIPSKPTPAAERICATMGLSLPTTPYQLD